MVANTSNNYSFANWYPASLWSLLSTFSIYLHPVLRDEKRKSS